VGCFKYRILEPVEASAVEVVFESIWRDLDAVKVAFGGAWQQSHLREGYSALTTAYSVHHFISESSTKSIRAHGRLGVTLLPVLLVQVGYLQNPTAVMGKVFALRNFLEVAILMFRPL
jgi:hypothetical protein